MEYYYCYLQLLGGLVLLILGGNYMVEAATNLARRFKVSSLVIGLTVVAFGTSLPELLVSLQSSLSGHSSIAMGNVVGSNIVNVGFIGGLTALLLPFFVERKSIRVDGMVMFAFTILLCLACYDFKIARWEGITGVVLIVSYIVWSIRTSQSEGDANKIEAPNRGMAFCIIAFLLSVIALPVGSDFMVTGASEVARRLSVSERVISLIVVAIGTSLPELAASLAAVIKKEVGITIGNIIGSNIFNIGIVLSLSSSIAPISFSKEFKSDLYWVVVFAALLIIGMLNVTRNFARAKETRDITKLWSSEHGEVGRIWGAFALLLYAFYIYTLFSK